MDPNLPPSAPRKVKFAPKAPPRRTPQPKLDAAASAEEDSDDDDDEAQQSLSRKVAEHLARRGPKADKKPSAQVAFMHGAASTGIRSFGRPRERAGDGSDKPEAKEPRLDAGQSLVNSVSDVEMVSTAAQELGENSVDSLDALTVKRKKKYKEPWDYDNSYYPTTLPWRTPNSGDPELLDEEEFGDETEYDENALLSAPDLGLLDVNDEPRLIFFQFPSNLPASTSPTSSSRRDTADNSKALEKGKGIADSAPKVSGTSTGPNGKEVAQSSMNPVTGYPARKSSDLEDLPKVYMGKKLEDLPEGYMGKMLVYRSGAVKLKLGDVLYDVSPGSECTFAQTAVAIDTTNGNCCELGKLEKRAVVSLDIDSMLGDPR